MRKLSIFLILTFLLTSLSACSGGGKAETKIKKKNVVEEALDKQLEEAEKKTEEETVIDEQVKKLEQNPDEEDSIADTDNPDYFPTNEEADAKNETGGGFAGQFGEEEFNKMLKDVREIKKTGDIDYDLTKITGDMVYAVVYLMMTEPESYIDKKFKMKGQYYAAYYEPNNKYYHYCFISDAAGCCEQGIEFALDDKFKYPDDFPKDGKEILVTGTFEKYTEDGKIFVRLKDSSMEILNEE